MTEVLNELLVILNQVIAILGLLSGSFIYYVPVVLGFILYKFFRYYTRTKYITNLKWVLLEIRLPREIKKTPLAMEVVLNSLYQTSDGSWYDHIFKGKVKDWFSLELVSLGGQVKFFIRTQEIYKDVIESQIYGQYPNVEIVEVPDYVKCIDYNKNKGVGWDMFGAEFILKNEDALPIKTYVDFGLDREGLKDEEKVDPMTATIEYLGTMNSDEQMWLQILVQASGKRFFVKGQKGRQDYQTQGQAMIDEIYGSHKPKEGEDGPEGRLTKVEEERVKAIERSVSKLGFDCGIRVLYWTKGDFRPSNVKGLFGIMRQYDSNNLNSFKFTNVTGVQFPWEDYKGKRVAMKKREIFEAYKRRGYFYYPYKKKPFVLNSEELATIFHFPGQVAETPTFSRIESRKAEPPINLPT